MIIVDFYIFKHVHALSVVLGASPPCLQAVAQQYSSMQAASNKHAAIRGIVRRDCMEACRLTLGELRLLRSHALQSGCLPSFRMRSLLCFRVDCTRLLGGFRGRTPARRRLTSRRNLLVYLSDLAADCDRGLHKRQRLVWAAAKQWTHMPARSFDRYWHLVLVTRSMGMSCEELASVYALQILQRQAGRGAWPSAELGSQCCTCVKLPSPGICDGSMLSHMPNRTPEHAMSSSLTCSDVDSTCAECHGSFYVVLHPLSHNLASS